MLNEFFVPGLGFLSSEDFSQENKSLALPSEQDNEEQRILQNELDDSDRELETSISFLARAKEEIRSLNQVSSIINKTSSNKELNATQQEILTASVENFCNFFNIEKKDFSTKHSFENFKSSKDLKFSMESVIEVIKNGFKKVLSVFKSIVAGIKNFFHKLFNKYGFYSKRYLEIKSSLDKGALKNNEGKVISSKEIFSKLNINKQIDLKEISKKSDLSDKFNADNFEFISKPLMDFVSSINPSSDVLELVQKSFKSDDFPKFLKGSGFSMMREANLFNEKKSVWQSNFYLPGNFKINIITKDESLNNDNREKVSVFHLTHPVDFNFRQDTITFSEFNLEAITDKEIDVVMSIIDNILDTKGTYTNQMNKIEKLADVIYDKFNNIETYMSGDYDRYAFQGNSYENDSSSLALINQASDIAYEMFSFMTLILKRSAKFNIGLLENMVNYLEKSVKLSVQQ